MPTDNVARFVRWISGDLPPVEVTNVEGQLADSNSDLRLDLQQLATAAAYFSGAENQLSTLQTRAVDDLRAAASGQESSGRRCLHLIRRAVRFAFRDAAQLNVNRLVEDVGDRVIPIDAELTVAEQRWFLIQLGQTVREVIGRRAESPSHLDSQTTVLDEAGETVLLDDTGGGRRRAIARELALQQLHNERPHLADMYVTHVFAGQTESQMEQLGYNTQLLRLAVGEIEHQLGN